MTNKYSIELLVIVFTLVLLILASTIIFLVMRVQKQKQEKYLLKNRIKNSSNN